MEPYCFAVYSIKIIGSPQAKNSFFFSFCFIWKFIFTWSICDHTYTPQCTHSHPSPLSVVGSCSKRLNYFVDTFKCAYIHWTKEFTLKWGVNFIPNFISNLIFFIVIAIIIITVVAMIFNPFNVLFSTFFVTF